MKVEFFYLISILLFFTNSYFIKTLNINSLYKLLLVTGCLTLISSIFIKYYKPNYNFMLTPEKLKISISYLIQTILLLSTCIILPISIGIGLAITSSIIFIDLLDLLFNYNNQDNEKDKMDNNAKKWIANFIIITGLICISYSKIDKKYKFIKSGIMIALLWGLLDAYNMISKKDDTKDDTNDGNEDSSLKEEIIKSNQILYELNIVGFVIISCVLILIKLFNIREIPYLYDDKFNIKFIFFFIMIQLLINYIGYILMFYSLNNMNISIYGSFMSFDILMGLIIGRLLLNERLGIKKIIGSIIVIIGVIYKAISLS